MLRGNAMSNWCIRSVSLALICLCCVSTLAMAAKLSGTVEYIDKTSRTIKLMTPPGPSREFQAPANVLQNLHIGERVEVEVSGEQVTAMRKTLSVP